MLHLARDDDDIDGRAQIVLAERLCEKEQAVETAIIRLFGRLRPRAGSNTPEMDDRLRSLVERAQISEQRVVIGALARVQAIHALAETIKRLSHDDPYDMPPVVPQSARDPCT